MTTSDQQDCSNCAAYLSCPWIGGGWCTMWTDGDPPKTRTTGDTTEPDWDEPKGRD